MPASKTDQCYVHVVPPDWPAVNAVWQDPHYSTATQCSVMNLYQASQIFEITSHEMKTRLMMENLPSYLHPLLIQNPENQQVRHLPPLSHHQPPLNPHQPPKNQYQLQKNQHQLSSPHPQSHTASLKTRDIVWHWRCLKACCFPFSANAIHRFLRTAVQPAMQVAWVELTEYQLFCKGMYLEP